MSKKLAKAAAAANLLSSVAKKAVAVGRRAAGAADVVGATKPVVFSCSHPGCIVAIATGSIPIVFSGKGGTLMPVGTYKIYYKVTGPDGAAFAVTCEGGTITPKPIQGVVPDTGTAGSRFLTVPA